MIRTWNRMGGILDWQALPMLIELYDVEDPEIMIEQLHALREHLQRQAGHG